MYHASKIATCCYCGNRTVLNLTGKVRHELACASCGAPLSRMKSLRADGPAAPVRPVETAARPHKVHKAQRSDWKDHRKRRRPRRLAARLFDLAEEVLDALD